MVLLTANQLFPEPQILLFLYFVHLQTVSDIIK